LKGNCWPSSSLGFWYTPSVMLITTQVVEITFWRCLKGII
jgi:hypothetical protein